MKIVEDLLSYAVKLTAGLIGVMVVLRVLGNKELAQVTPLDFVYALILGSIIEESIYDTQVKFYEMMLTLAYWGALIFVIERFALKNERFRRWTKGTAELIINDGEIDNKVLDKSNMDVDEVRELLRLKGVFSLRDVKYAILETSGQLSVIKYAGEEPVLRKEVLDLHDENAIAYLFIDAGKIEYYALKQAGKDEEWLKQSLEEETGYNLKDVYIAEWNENDGYYIQTK